MHILAKTTITVLLSAFFAQAQAQSNLQGNQGQQEGVVYPGQPNSSTETVKGQASVGRPGTPLQRGGVVPNLPALPGEVSIARQAVDDIVPEDLAKELKELRVRVDNVMREGSTSVNTSAKPKSSHVELTQQPNEDPPIVRVAMGMPTNLIFTDVTGAPWPIEYATPGANGQFEIMLPAAGTPTMQIRPKNGYAYGGVSVKLVDNPIPVSVTVTAAQKIVDVRLDVVVLKRGPNAKAPMIDATSANGTPADQILTMFLYGSPPTGARLLKSSARSVTAWNYNNFMYVRSTVPLVSPNPLGSSRTVDGTYAYAFTQVPVVNITVDGVISSVFLTE